MKQQKKKWRIQDMLYPGIFFVFMVICCLAAGYNGRFYEFASLALWQLIGGIVVLCLTVWKEGNVKIVLWSCMLITIGLLAQTMIQQEAAYERYLSKYVLFAVASILVSVCMWLIYTRVYIHLPNRIKNIVIWISIAGVLGALSLFGSMQNDAKLWITIGGVSIQITEFLKPLFVLGMAGILCTRRKVSGKVSVAIQIGALVCCFIVAGVLISFFNEFGTGIVIVLTGITMIFIFQNSDVYKIFVLCILGLSIIGLFLVCRYESKIQNIPEQCFEKGEFSAYFASWANRGELKSYLEKQIETLDIDKRKEKEEELNNYEINENKLDLDGLKLDITYQKIIYFLEFKISDEEIAACYEEPKENPEKQFSKAQRLYCYYIEKLASDKSFRGAYEEAFLKRKDEKDIQLMLSAFEACCGDETDGKLSLKERVEYGILKNYMKMGVKIERKMRGFLYPEQERNDASYHVNQARRAIAQGGVTGNGPDILIDKITPDKPSEIYSIQSDMVFCMVVSEFGSIAGILVILLNMLIFKEAVQIALNTSDFYHKGVAIGLGLSWIYQSFIIIMGNCGLFPFTGITLPFISEGGTSFLVSVMTIVLLVLISVKPIYVPLKKEKEKRKGKKDRRDRETMENKEESLKEDEPEGNTRKEEKNTATKTYSYEKQKSDRAVTKTSTKQKEAVRKNKENQQEEEDLFSDV